MQDRYNKWLFTIAALWNWIFAITGITIANCYPSYVTFFVPRAPESPIFVTLFLALVFSFGVGYYWAANYTLQNRSVIKLGIIGKLLVFVIVLYGWAVNQVTMITFLGGTGDFIFSLFFMKTLSGLPKQ